MPAKSTPTAKSPAKRSRVSRNLTDVEALRMTIDNLSGRSKKTADDDSGYEVDVPSTPDRSPKKKQKRETTSAVPGSPEFDALPPVSITAKGLNPDKLFGKLSFGSIDESNDDVEVLQSCSVTDRVEKTGRIRKLSEKAQYMKDNTVPNETVSNEAPLLPGLNPTKGSPSIPPKNRSIDSEQGVENLAMSDIDKEIEKWKQIKASAEHKAKSRALPEAGNDERVVIPSPKHKEKLPVKIVSSVRDDEVEAVVPSSKPKVKSLVKNVAPPSDSVEVIIPSSKRKGKQPAKNVNPALDSDAESMLKVKSPVKKVIPALDSDVEVVIPSSNHKGKRLVKNVPPALDSDAESTHKGKSSIKKVNPVLDSDSESSGEPNDKDNPFLDISSVENFIGDDHSSDGVSLVNDPVMRIEWQDPLLKPFYMTLPRLSYCEISPFLNGTPMDIGTMILYEPLRDLLDSKKEKRRFLSGLNFESHRCYFNPARISPSALLNNKGRLYVKNSRSVAILITTGAVAHCNLIAAAHGGTTAAPFRIKNISLYPLRQEYARTASCIGTALGVKSLYGPVSGGIMTFSTRKEGANVGISTPKRKGLFGDPQSLGGTDTSYPTSLGFEADVPIYDGRSSFNFSATDFDNLRSLPLYEDGNVDLHPYSIISVGYSVNTYKYTVGGESALALSPNVLFVIVLGIPSD